MNAPGSVAPAPAGAWKIPTARPVVPASATAPAPGHRAGGAEPGISPLQRLSATTPRRATSRAERCLRLGHGQRPIAAGQGTAGRCAKIGSNLHGGASGCRGQMRAAPFHQRRTGLFVGKGGLVHTAADGRRTSAKRAIRRADTGMASPQALRGSRCRPIFPGGCRQFPLASLIKTPRMPGAARRPLQWHGAPAWCGFHDLELVHRQLAGLEQDGVGDADLANVVQRGGLCRANRSCGR